MKNKRKHSKQSSYWGFCPVFVTYAIFIKSIQTLRLTTIFRLYLCLVIQWTLTAILFIFSSVNHPGWLQKSISSIYTLYLLSHEQRRKFSRSPDLSSRPVLLFKWLGTCLIFHDYTGGTCGRHMYVCRCIINVPSCQEATLYEPYTRSMSFEYIAFYVAW